MPFLVVRLNSSVHTWWYHLITNSFHRHHWSRALILCASLLVTAQHSESYRKTGRMQVSFGFSLVEKDILDFQIWLSRFCNCKSDGITTWDTRSALSCWVNKGAKIDKFLKCCNLLLLNCDSQWLILSAAQFVFCQFTSSPRDAPSDAITSGAGTRSSSTLARSAKYSYTNECRPNDTTFMHVPTFTRLILTYYKYNWNQEQHKKPRKTHMKNYKHMHKL